MKAKLIFCVLFIVILTAIMCRSYGQLIINEISSRNDTCLSDFDGDQPDWIELLNISSQPINIQGYYISDDLEQYDKWSFPELVLPPDSHLVVFASDKNRKAIVDHWETAILAGENWKYWIPFTEPDTAWNQIEFNDSDWLEGPGGFGRGDGDDNTVLPDTVATVYLRKLIVIPDTSIISHILLHVDYDDAFVAYLNGTEIARANIGWPGKIQKWDDFAYGPHLAKMFQGLPIEEFPVSSDLFMSIIRPGENVLAIQALNAWNNHGNFSIIPYLSFGIKNAGTTYQAVPEWFGQKPIHFHTNFELSGEGESVILSNPGLTVIDQVNYPYMKADHSYGRATDGSLLWKFFSHPTPGNNNELSSGASGYAKEPQFNLESGFYDSSVSVGFINYLPSDTIRYTLDGSWVTDSSAIYSGTLILLDSTVVIRAQVYKTGLLPGKTASNTYIIGYVSTFPVISISLNPHDLWDWEDGIYVLGPNAGISFPHFGANFWMDWQKPSHIEYFDENKNLAFELDADIMIHGGFSRAYAMKSLRVLTDGKYDESTINYQLFKDKNIHSFSKFVLRNSGQDFNKTHFRDALMHKIVQNSTEIDIQDYQPSVVFLNGQYWGIHNIREKIDGNYVNENFGIHQDSVHLLRVNIKVVEGNYYQYMQMIDYIINVPVVDSIVYDSISKLVDINNYTDYFVAEMYYVNPDWPNNNIKYWRAFADTSRWRYIMTDTDPGLGLASQVQSNELYRILHSNILYVDNHRILRRLMENPDYRKYFINRSADMFNTMLLPQNINLTIDFFKERLAPEMPAHFAKWGGNMDDWESKVQSMKNFVINRPGYVWQDYIEEFNLNKLVTVNLCVDTTGQGKIKINTIIPDSLPWQGTYFDGNPVEIKAIPDSGYIFSHWKSNLSISGEDTLKQYLDVNIDTNDIFKAFFVLDTSIITLPKIVFSEINYHSSDTLDSGDWIEILNADTSSVDFSGWKFKDDDDNHEFMFPSGLILEANQYLMICRDTVKFKNIYQDTISFSGQFGFGLASTGDSLRLYNHAGILIVSMAYTNQAPWPTGADGTGKTLELKDPFSNLNSGTNWFAGCLGGSPGGSYTECDTLDVSIITEQNNIIRIYPNPPKGMINVEIFSGNHDVINLIITEMLGNPMFTRTFNIIPYSKNVISINTTMFHKGVYFMTLRGGTLNYSAKFLVH